MTWQYPVYSAICQYCIEKHVAGSRAVRAISYDSFCTQGIRRYLLSVIPVLDFKCKNSGPFQVMNNQRAISRFILYSSLLMISLVEVSTVHSAELLQGGNFESATPGGWTFGGENGGFGFIAAEGTCFSDADTTQLTLPGFFSAAIRSGSEGRKDQIGTLTSGIFVAGDGIVFQALSEAAEGRRARDPVTFFVRIYDGDTNLQLLELELTTNHVKLRSGCGLYQRNAGFSTHFISTGLFRGQNIRLQFRQHTNKNQFGFFTLIDNITRYAEGELPLMMGMPIAVAGTSKLDGLLHLDASLSFDPADEELTYTWYIHDDAIPRLGKTVSIADLEDGQYTVTLYISDGTNQVADTMLLSVQGNEPGAVPLPGINPEETDTDTGDDGLDDDA